MKKFKCLLGFMLAIGIPFGGLFVYACYTIGILAAIGVYLGIITLLIMIFTGVYLMGENC